MTKETMRIFRAADAPVHRSPPDAVKVAESSLPGVARATEAGLKDGYVLKLLFEAPGFALHYAWFKPNYLLNRHSHDLAGLYYIIAGSMQMGAERLGAGDGIYVPADTTYAYTVGPEGLEILEFRHEAHFKTLVSGASPAFWERTLATIAANRETWLTAEPPGPARLKATLPADA